MPPTPTKHALAVTAQLVAPPAATDELDLPGPVGAGDLVDAIVRRGSCPP